MFANPRSDSDTGPDAGRVWLEDGLINQTLVGDQTAETVATTTRETDRIVEQLQAKHEPVLILSDFTNVGEQTQEARDALRDTLGTRYFDRIAVFGVPTRLQIVGRLLLTLTGKGDRIRIFDTKEQATAWLRTFVSES